MNVTHQVQLYVNRIPRGKPFTTYSLLECGARAAIDQALSRLTASGKIVRLTRGVYIKPEKSRFVGQYYLSHTKLPKSSQEKQKRKFRSVVQKLLDNLAYPHRFLRNLFF